MSSRAASVSLSGTSPRRRACPSPPSRACSTTRPMSRPRPADLVQRAVDRLGAQAPGRGGPARGPPRRRLPALPVPADRLLRTDRLVDRRDARTARPAAAAQRGRGGAAGGGAAALAGRPGIGGAILVLPPEPGEQLVALRARGSRSSWSTRAADAARHRRRLGRALRRRPQLTAHLVELGHRRIGVIAGPHNWLASERAWPGTPRRWPMSACCPIAAAVRRRRADRPFGYHAAGAAARPARAPTALIGFNDKAAVGALAAAAERGLRVPEDLSVAGFDDIDLAQATRPCSRPSASRWRRWAASPSASSSG